MSDPLDTPEKIIAHLSRELDDARARIGNLNEDWRQARLDRDGAESRVRELLAERDTALQQCANVARHVSELEAEIARIDSARDNLPDFDWGRAAAMKVTVAAIGIPAEPGPNTATPSGQEKT